MILSYEKEDENLTPFEKFFLFEAPLEKPKRKNVKVIKVRGGSRGKDYTQLDGENADNEADTPEDTDTGDTEETDDTEDYTADDDTEEDNTEDNADTDTDTDNEDTDNTGDNGDEETEDNEDYTSDEDNTDGDDNTDDDGEETEDNEDYTSDNGDDNTDDNNDNEDDGENKSEDEKATKIEKLRKYNLFKDFIKLRQTLENYIEKLDTLIFDDNEINSLYKNITNRFRALDDLIYDYMIIKFERNTYFKSFLFYQRVIATIQFNIDLLEKIKVKSESLNKSKNNKLK